MTTDLTLPQRAAVALGAAEHEKNLVLLAAEAQTITEIKNKDGREQCHSMMMTLKNARIAIEKTGKAAREDAKNFANAVIAEEKRLIAITEAEETRLQKLRDQWDAAIEAERQAKIEAERQRVAGIRARIDEMRNAPLKAVGMPATAVRHAAQLIAGTIIDDGFAEFRDEAMAVRSDAFNKLEAAAIAAEEQEAEAARLKAEREELARLRAEAEARRKEDERKAAEDRARQEAELKAAREAQEAEDALVSAFEHGARRIERDSTPHIQKAINSFESGAKDWDNDTRPRVVAALAAARAYLRDRLEAAKTREQQEAELAAQRAELERQNEELATAQRELREAEERRIAEEAERARLQAAADQALADARNPSADVITLFEQAPAEIVAEAPPTPPTLRLGQIGERLGFTVTADFLTSLGFPPAATDKSAKLYHEASFDPICEALKRHISGVQQRLAA